MKHIYEVFHAGPADFGRFHVVAENRQQAKARAQADYPCLLYTSPSPRDATLSRMPSSA